MEQWSRGERNKTSNIHVEFITSRSQTAQNCAPETNAINNQLSLIKTFAEAALILTRDNNLH